MSNIYDSLIIHHHKSLRQTKVCHFITTFRTTAGPTQLPEALFLEMKLTTHPCLGAVCSCPYPLQNDAYAQGHFNFTTCFMLH